MEYKDYSIFNNFNDDKMTSHFDRVVLDSWCECDTINCSGVAFATYDNDGDLVALAYASGDATTVLIPYYKKAGTEDTPATKPIHQMQGPCIYMAEFQNIQNNSMDVSFCRSCDRLNTLILNDYSGLYQPDNPNSLNFIFGSEVSDNLYTGGLYDASLLSVNSVCYINNLTARVYLDPTILDSGRPAIVAEAILHSYDDGYGGSQFDIRTIMAWRKVLDYYNGDWYAHGNIAYPSGMNHGNYDGRSFSVTFNYGDMFVPPEVTPYVPMVSGVCDFTNATLTISDASGFVVDNEQYHYGGMHTAFVNYPPMSYICTEYTAVDDCGNTYQLPTPNLLMRDTFTITPNHIILSIDGVVSIDDSKDVNELNRKSCLNCFNSDGNTTYINMYLTSNFSVAPGYAYWFADEDVIKKTCCLCEGEDSCISYITCQIFAENHTTYYSYYIDVKFYTSVYPALYVSNNDDLLLATFRKNLGDSTQYPLGLDCTNLSFDGFELIYELEPNDDTNYRCDFSNASLTIDFHDVNVLHTGKYLNVNRYNSLCSLGEEPMPDIVLTIDAGNQPYVVSGEFMFDWCTDSWYYNDGITSISLNIGYDVVTNKYKIVVQYELMGIILSRSTFTGYIDPQPGTGAPKRPTDFLNRTGTWQKYMDCADLNGLILNMTYPPTFNGTATIEFV